MHLVKYARRIINERGSFYETTRHFLRDIEKFRDAIIRDFVPEESYVFLLKERIKTISQYADIGKVEIEYFDKSVLEPLTDKQIKELKEITKKGGKLRDWFRRLTTLYTQYHRNI